MSLEDAKAKWRAKNARSQKVIPVEIDEVGTVWVRELSVRDTDVLESMAKSEDGGGYGMVMAGLLCDESGKRLSDKERAEWEEIFADATWQDFLTLSNASKGVQKADDSGNSAGAKPS